MNLSLFECLLLKRLAENVGEVVTREELIKALYPNGPKHSPDSNCLEVFVLRIRKTIGYEYIKTERNKGYRLVRLPEGMTPNAEPQPTENVA